MIHIFPIYGLGGHFVSRGVDVIAERACAAHPQIVRHASRAFYEGEAILKELDALPTGALIVFVAHSNGVHTATQIAFEQPNRRFVVVGIDPTWLWPMRPVPLGKNVVAALSIVGRDNGSLCGHAALECAENVTIPIERIATNTPHVAIDDDPDIQAACLAFLDRVLKEAAA